MANRSNRLLERMSKKQSVDEFEVRTSRESTPLLDEFPPIRPYPLKPILTAVWLGSFMAAIDNTIVANIMSVIAAEFEQEDLKSWIATSFLLTITAFQPLYGKVSDIVGRKYALLFGQFFFALGCLLCSLARSVPEFALARAVAGIGGGGMTALSSVIVSDIVTLEERGLFQGYANINFAAGQMIGAPLGGWALQTIGWRWAFGIQVPCLFICMILTYRNINIPPRQPFSKESFEKIDFGGSFTLVSFISSFLLLLSTDLNKFVLSLNLIVSLGAFIYIEKYVAKEQILPTNLFKGILGVLSILSFLISFSIYSMFFSIPVFLQVVQDQTTTQSGRFLIAQVVFVSVGSVAAGVLIKRFKTDVIKTSIWITFVSLIILIFAFGLLYGVLKYPSPYDTNTGWKGSLVLSLSLIGYGYGKLLVSILVAIVAIVGPDGQAAATGLNYLFRSVGSVLGTGLSLSSLEISLKQRLSILLSDVSDGETILKNVLHNANYIKSGALDDKLKIQILEAYQKAMVSSFTPAIYFTITAILIAGALALKKGF